MLEIDVTECCSYCTGEPAISSPGIGNMCAEHAWIFAIPDWRQSIWKKARRNGIRVPKADLSDDGRVLRLL